MLPPSHQPIESWPSDRTHQPLPFAKTSAEAEGARFVVTKPRCDLTALAALRVVRVRYWRRETKMCEASGS